jgi:hypothetical protein
MATGMQCDSRANSLVDRRHKRFPWPPDSSQRYDGRKSPYLAVVNARGKWAVWRHGSANPPFIPLCLSLAGKDFWIDATDRQRSFALRMWMRAAAESYWGIIWGDPFRLAMEWRMDCDALLEDLEWFIRSGLGCYLSFEQKLAAESWRNGDRAGGLQGEPPADSRGGKGGHRLKQSKQSKQSQAEQAEQDKQSKQSLVPDQIPDHKARDDQIPDSGKQGKDSKQASNVTGTAQDAAQAQPQGQEPASLPKSDLGAASGHARLPGAARGPRSRPRSVSREPVPVGNLLAWNDPRSVSFARRMYEAINGQAPPADLQSSPESVRGDVGVWVHYWWDEVRAAISVSGYQEFEDRCVKDIAKKRRCRGITNLGGLARKKIVPGVLATMTQGAHGK